jgi:nucleoid DNA-binding protein
MNKEELIKRVCKKNKQLKSEDVNNVINVSLDVIKEAMLSNEKILLSGLFSLVPYVMKERTGRNIKTGEKIPIPQKKNYSIRISRNLKQQMND